ncbi:MAG: sigma-70 family RNA polymerase sigma factor [Phycisphaerales bacterium]|nr:sigma-70 family RNA polymerase sigma factor [Phycisphaerales bacterium]
MPETDVTRLIQLVASGRSAAVDELLPLVYAELRALAESHLRRERAGHTLQATSLVHEAYIKLVDQTQAQWRDRAHFFAVAAHAIRRILVDYARTRGRIKRGGGRTALPLEDAAAAHIDDNHIDMLALDEALQRLGQFSTRQARVVELRYFGGMTTDEIAKTLDVAPSTVDGDWAMARAWLCRELRGESSNAAE